MPAVSMPPKDALQRLLDGLQMFIREHLSLARAEMKADLRAMGRALAMGAAGVPALAAGYLLVMFAIGCLLALVLPAWAAFGIVGVVNLGAGAALTASGLSRARQNRVELRRTSREIERDRAWLAGLAQSARGREAALGPAREPALASGEAAAGRGAVTSEEADDA